MKKDGLTDTEERQMMRETSTCVERGREKKKARVQIGPALLGRIER